MDASTHNHCRSARMLSLPAYSRYTPEIPYKKPHFQYKLYQGCGFLCFISGCMRCPVLTLRVLLDQHRVLASGYAKSGP
eukprot:3941505-Rhodomonas_salina.3